MTLGYLEIFSRFCSVKNKDVRIRINLTLTELLEGDDPVIQGGESKCSNRNECKIKQCQLITEEENKFADNLRSEYKELKKQKREREF